MSCRLENANRPNFYKQPQDINVSASRFKGKHLVSNLIRKQTKNMMTPQLIASVIMKDKRFRASGNKGFSRKSIGTEPKKRLFRTLLAGRMSAI